MNDQNTQVQNRADETSEQKQVTASVAKETEPIIGAEPLVVSSEVEPELHPEVKAAGVETVSEKLKLTEDHLKTGISHAKESTPVETEPSGRIKYPISEHDAKQALKVHQKVKKSIAWLALSVLRQIDMMRGGKND